MTDNSISRLAGLIAGGSVVFFGGAGVSTESGIPDFRSEKGLYNAKQSYGRAPEEMLSRSFFLSDPETFYRYYKENLIATWAKPNKAHLALAEFEKRGLLNCVITQNTDCLHQAAGSVTVHELHGSKASPYCVSCGKRYTLEFTLESEERGEGPVPKCEKCGGIVRPDVVLYEESLDNDVIESAVRAIAGAKTLIIGGTSLAVYPAAGLLRYYKGDDLVLINKGETPYDDAASLVIRDPIGETLDAALRML